MAGKALPQGSFDQIIAAARERGETRDIQMPAWGCNVKIRGLTRNEVLLANGLPQAEQETNYLHLGFVDPQLTLEQARELRETEKFGVLENVLEEILELSGLGAEFRKKHADLLREG